MKEEENKINNDTINTVVKSLTFLSNESKSKRTEMDQIRSAIKKGKIEYNKEIKKYSLLMENIINLENEIENIERIICKKKHRQKLLYSAINSSFYLNLKDTKNQIHQSVFENFLLFCGFTQYKNELDIFNTTLKDENELKSLLDQGEKFQNNIFTSEQSLYSNINQKIAETKQNQQIPYPFSDIYDIITNIYEIISFKKETQKLLTEIEFLTLQKNNIFIGLKTLENQIVKNDLIYKDLQTYLKGINAMLEKYNIIKQKNDVGNYLLFANSLKEFSNITWSKASTLNDLALSSMTVQSEFSEDKSDISSLNTISYIKKVTSLKTQKNTKHCRNQTMTSAKQMTTEIEDKNNSCVVHKENNSFKENELKQSKSQTIIEQIRTYKNNRSSLEDLMQSSNFEVDSVCEEVSPIQRDKMRIGKLVIKTQKRSQKCIQKRNNELEIIQFERHNPSCGCCMSCT